MEYKYKFLILFEIMSVLPSPRPASKEISNQFQITKQSSTKPPTPSSYLTILTKFKYPTLIKLKNNNNKYINSMEY